MANDWKTKLIKEYSSDFNHITFLNSNYDIIPGRTRENKRRKVKYLVDQLSKSRNAKTLNNNTSLSNAQSMSFSNGQFISDRIIEVANGQLITPDVIMQSHNLDPKIWEVVSYKNNFYQSQAKNNKVIELYQSKVVVKPKISSELTIDDIDAYLDSKDFSTRIKVNKPITYDNSDEFLEIDTADLHCGLLAWRNETGSDYDLQICSDRFLSGISDVVERSKHKHFSDVYICGLGDILHIDNDRNETTKGTLQQADGRLTKIFDFAFDTMNTAIDLLRGLNSKIHYIYLAGNHDRTTGYFLAKCLKLANPDIDFDITPNPQKAIHVGNVLIGLTHGDMPKYNKGTWLINDFRKEFGESHFVEEHCGHIHTEEAKMYNGIMVRSLLAQCGNSYWEHQQGYRSHRGIMCFVWNKEIGLRETWYYYY